MKIGVLGLGTIAPYFLQAIADDPGYALAAICDTDEDKLAQLEHLGAAAFTDVADLLAADIVEAVVVTLPNHLHAPVASAALARGVHVCCEKPLALTSAEADTMVDASVASGATLFTAFHRGYNRNLLDLAARLRPLREQVVDVRVRYHENISEHTGDDSWYLDPTRSGGGCLIDNGPNAVDAAWRLLGPLTLTDAAIGDVRSGSEFYAAVDLADTAGIPVRVELDWGLPTGEIKDVTVRLRDGSELTADMLAGFAGFKASLAHEYHGILADFRDAVTAGPAWTDHGPQIVRLIETAYRVARRREDRLRMIAKAPVQASLVKLLFHYRDDRGMTLSPWDTRCVARGEVHELVTTVDRPQRAGDTVDRVGFLGFVEFSAATVLGRGDRVLVAGRQVGTVRGFDECHFPNHYNILVETDRVLSAADLDLRVGHEIQFAPPAG